MNRKSIYEPMLNYPECTNIVSTRDEYGRVITDAMYNNNEVMTKKTPRSRNIKPKEKQVEPAQKKKRKIYRFTKIQIKRPKT